MKDFTSFPKSYYGAGSYVPGPPPSPVPVCFAKTPLLHKVEICGVVLEFGMLERDFENNLDSDRLLYQYVFGMSMQNAM